MALFDPKAEDAVRDWLALADAGDAKATWSSAAVAFQRAVPEDQWARALATAREPLGAVVSRALREATPMTELPGAPCSPSTHCSRDQLHSTRTSVAAPAGLRKTTNTSVD